MYVGQRETLGCRLCFSITLQKIFSKGSLTYITSYSEEHSFCSKTG